MKTTKAKLLAREWIIQAIQNYQVPPDKKTQKEIRKFIERLQRDIRSLERARERAFALDLMVNKDFEAAIERDRS
jgi:hypothetical protein